MTIQKWTASLGLVLAIAGGSFVVGCEEKTPAEKTGDAVERAADKTKDAAEKAGDKVENAAEKTGDKLEEAGDKAKDATH